MRRDAYLTAALALHRYLVAAHWTEQGLVGPDPGVRFNYRLGRFVKSALRGLPWGDAYAYCQSQGYWILANWQLCRLLGDPAYGEIATQGATIILAQQRDDGAWDYPNPEWRGRVATTEGGWASNGLLETYRQTGERQFLAGALAWDQYLTSVIGFQTVGDEVSANYFAQLGQERVPNCSIDVLRYRAELGDAAGDASHRALAPGLLTFLERAQQPTGEFPYSCGAVTHGRPRLHFQCFQYNAFECLNLIRYHELAGDPNVLPMIERLLHFLRGGLTGDGHAYYDCAKGRREVTYHAAALAAVFARAEQIGIDGYAPDAQRAYAYLLRRQLASGGFPHSRHDYGVLRDLRSYPRYLAMILHFLLLPFERAEPAERSLAISVGRSEA